MNKDYNTKVYSTIVLDVCAKWVDEVYKALDADEESCYLEVDVPCGGTINVDGGRKHKTVAEVYNSKGKKLPLLSKEIEDSLLLWSTIKDEWLDDRGYEDDRVADWQVRYIDVHGYWKG